MFKWFLDKLESRGRKLVIYDREGVEPYLTRYYVAYPDGDMRKSSGMRQDIPYNTFLHQFMRSDDPVYHTHPWDWYFTIILKGGYWAHTPWGTKWYGPGSMYYMNCRKMKFLKTGPMHQMLLPENLHWVEIPKPGETWTLFTRGKTIGNWGFWADENSPRIVPHDKYLEEHKVSK